MAKASSNIFPKVQFSEESAPATPSTGQAVVYVKTDGKLYLKDDAGTETDLTDTGASGGTVPEWIERLDAVSGSANADDDEFNDGSIAGAWTQTTVSGSATWTEDGDRLSVVASNQTSGDMAKIVRSMTATTPPITISTHVRVWHHGPSSTKQRFGIGFWDGTTSAANFVGLVSFWDGSAADLKFSNRAGTSTSIGFVSDIVDDIYQPILDIFVRITYVSSNTWKSELSHDGFNWYDWGVGNFARTLTPTHYGLLVMAEDSASSEIFASFEYFRVS